MSQRGPGHFSSWFMPLFLSSPKDVRPHHRSPKGKKKEILKLKVFHAGPLNVSFTLSASRSKKLNRKRMWGRELKLGSSKHFLHPTFRNFQSFRHTSYVSRPGKLQINIYPGELMRLMFGMRLTTFDFQRCFPSRACAAVTLDPVGRVTSMLTKRNDARERELLTLSLLNHLWPCRSNWRHVRDRNTTLGYISAHVTMPDWWE